MYTPELSPGKDGDLGAYIQRELDKVAEELRNISVSSINFEVHKTAPSRPINNMVMSFDASVHGVEGLYQYVGGAWVKL